MSTLRRIDLHAGLRLVGGIAEACLGDPGAFAAAGVAALPGLVASELTTLSVCDLASAHRSVVGNPGASLSAADRAAFDRHFHEHPLVRFHALVRGQGAHRISDCMSLTRFRRTSLYADYYRRIGIDHAVALPMHVDRGTLVSFVLNRRGRDFSDRECELLDLVGAQLTLLFRRAAATTAGLASIAGPAAPGASGETARTHLVPMTPREREVLQWVGTGKTDRDIAELLGCSPRTVQKHLEHVYTKLGVETRTAAVMRALARGLLS
jgi:DNA-binding CsgD family transcriptional regulator